MSHSLKLFVTPCTAPLSVTHAPTLAELGKVIAATASASVWIVPTSARQLTGLPAGEPATDETYTVDNDAPGLTSFTRSNPVANPTAATRLIAMITALKPVAFIFSS